MGLAICPAQCNLISFKRDRLLSFGDYFHLRLSSGNKAFFAIRILWSGSLINEGFCTFKTLKANNHRKVWEEKHMFFYGWIIRLKTHLVLFWSAEYDSVINPRLTKTLHNPKHKSNFPLYIYLRPSRFMVRRVRKSEKMKRQSSGKWGK